MTDSTIKVGIVGCGEIAQLMHLPIIRELPGVEIVALCDLSQQVLQTLGRDYNISALYTDYNDLISDDNVDVVVVCTFDHGPVVEAALHAGKHVTVEKPLAFTAAEAAPLVELAKQKQVQALIGYMKLYDTGYTAGIAHMAEIKQPKAVHVHNFAGRFDRYQQLYTQVRGTDIDPDILAAGKAEVDARIEAALGSDHAGYKDLYMTLLMLGSHNLAVLRGAYGTAVSVDYAKAIGPSHIFAALTLANDIPCTFEVSFGAQYEWWDEWIVAYGQDEEIRIDFENPYIRNTAATVTIREPLNNGPSKRIIPGLPDTSFRQQWMHFIDCIKGRAEPHTSLEGGLEDLELAEKIIKALPPLPKAG